MKMITAMVFTYVCLSFGCVTDDPTPLPEEAEAAQEVLTFCSSHDACPVGTYCDVGGVCSGFVIGPNPGPVCGNDHQCSPYGLRCTNTSPNLGTYGSCVSPSCSAQYSLAYVPAGGTTFFNVSSNAPSGSFSRLYGTRDNRQDAFGDIFQLTSGSFPILNSPGLAGSYMRYVDMYAPNGQFWCETATTTTYFAP